MIFQAPAPTPWPSPIGLPPQALFERYFHDLVNKTWGNISPLYQLDMFDWTVLLVYFGILTVLAIYGVYRVKQVVDFWRYSKFPPKPKGEGLYSPTRGTSLGFGILSSRPTAQ